MRYSIEAEQAVLGGLLEDPNKFDDVSEVVTEADFYDARHRKYFSIMASLSAKGTVFDVITVSEAVEADDPDALGYLAELMANSTGAANLLTYARIVADRAMERVLAAAGQTVYEIATDPDRDLDEKINAVHGELAALERQEKAETLSFDQLLKNEIAEIDRKFRGDVTPGLKVGFEALDRRFGGIEPTDFWLLAARPAMGKTTLAVNIAHQVAQSGKKVLIFSLEMSKEQLMKRLIATSSNLSYGAIRTAHLQEDDFPRLNVGATKLKGMPIHIYDIAGLDINRAQAIARKFARSGDLGLIVVDYLQLMTDKSAKSRFDEVSNVSRKLKGIAKTCNTPVLALSQLSRKVEDRTGSKKPGNSDLRESGQLEQDADIITFIYRDEVYHPDSPDAGTAELITTKFRNGEVGTDRLATQLHRSRFVDLDPNYSIPERPQAPTRSRALN